MFNYKCGRTFDDVMHRFHISEDDSKIIKKTLFNDGYREQALCYVATVSEDKLAKYIGDSRFASIFINEVRKHAYKPGDKRWGLKSK